jgi:hypothetical protein
MLSTTLFNFDITEFFLRNFLPKVQTVNPGKIGLDELYNLDSVFEIVRRMKYCRAVPEVVKSKENWAYLKDFISKVGDENSSEVCFRSIFPDCPDKMKTFLFSQKWHLRGIQMGVGGTETLSACV